VATSHNRLFSRGSRSETRRLSEILRQETVGGLLLLLSATLAIVLANSPWAQVYQSLREFTIGPAALHLDLKLEVWAADGLLAIFFFVVGLELKREFVAGDLRDPRRAALPIVGAIAGMIVPASLYVFFNLNGAEGALRGWAIPAATDIAFALAVLAVVGTFLPTALRTFLLTLAVVDDLLAILVIAIFYTSEVSWNMLGLSLIPLFLFGVAVQKRVRSLWLLVPLAVTTWALFHESGVHATVAGVLLGFTVPVLMRGRREPDTDEHSMAEDFEHALRPLSAGFAVPVFAFFAAGVSVGGVSGFVSSLTDPIALGIMAGLVMGKPLGIFVSTYLLAKFTKADLDPSLTWTDVLGAAMLAGVGFTVSLLIGKLAFLTDPVASDHVKVAVLTGSVLAAAGASVILLKRNRFYRSQQADELLEY